MNDSFFIGPCFIVTFGYVMPAVIEQGCISPAEKEVDKKGQVTAIIIGYSHLPESGSERSQWLEQEDGSASESL